MGGGGGVWKGVCGGEDEGSSVFFSRAGNGRFLIRSGLMLAAWFCTSSPRLLLFQRGSFCWRGCE